MATFVRAAVHSFVEDKFAILLCPVITAAAVWHLFMKDALETSMDNRAPPTGSTLVGISHLRIACPGVNGSLGLEEVPDMVF